MKSNKKYFILIIVITSLIILYFLFELFGFIQGVNNDTKKTLLTKKEYLIQTYFRGKVVSKNICDKCSELKWGIIIQIDTIKESSSTNIMDRSYQPYYGFEKDSLLYIKVPQNIYNKIEIGNTIIKKHGSVYININDVEVLQLLSKDDKKWLHSE